MDSHSRIEMMSVDIAYSLSLVLDKLMTACNINNSQLSEKTGVPVAAIACMCSAESSNPTVMSLRSIASYFGISISQLLGDEPLSMESSLHRLSNLTQVPLISCHHVDAFLQNKSIEPDLIQRWVSVDLPVSQASFCLKVQEWRLAQSCGNEAMIVVDPNVTPVSMDYVLVRSEDDATVFVQRVMFDGDSAYLVSENVAFEATKVKDRRMVLGVVVEIHQLCHRDSVGKPKAMVNCYAGESTHNIYEIWMNAA